MAKLLLDSRLGIGGGKIAIAVYCDAGDTITKLGGRGGGIGICGFPRRNVYGGKYKIKIKLR